jgi:hypothetical protein
VYQKKGTKPLLMGKKDGMGTAVTFGPGGDETLPHDPRFTYPFLRALCTAIQWTKEYDHSNAREELYVSFLGFAKADEWFDHKRRRLGYLSNTILLFHSPHGVLGLTQHQHQYNVNHLVPKSDAPETVYFLVYDFLDYLTAHHLEYATTFRHVKEQVPFFSEEQLERPRRFVPSSRNLCDLEYHAPSKTVTLWDQVVEVHAILEGVAQLSQYRPLSTASLRDPEEQLYWHRFQCGTLVVLPNPKISLMKPLSSFPSPLSPTFLKSCFDPLSLGTRLLRALRPAMEDITWVLQNTWIPRGIRRLLFWPAIRNLGLQDDLMCLAHTSFGYVPLVPDIEELCDLHLLSQITMIGYIIHNSGTMNPPTIVSRLMESIQPSHPRFHELWHRWVLQSPFIFACMSRFSPSLLKSMYGRCPIFRYTLCHYLQLTIGNWSASDREKACMLDTEKGDDPCDPLMVVQTEVRRLDLEQSRHATELDVMVQTDASTPKQTKKKKKKKKTIQEEGVEVGVENPQETTVDRMERQTHHSLVTRLEQWVGFPCELIGSGIFFDSNDADVILTAPRDVSLEEAYRIVRDLTDWTPCYERVSGEHVAVLTGVFEHVQVDLQIWRGHCGCPAERCTESALRLTRSLTTCTDKTRRRCVCLLHGLVEEADLKGHRMCRLPGVAVTCIAIVLGCRLRDEDSVHERLLWSSLRDMLSCEAPCVNMDDVFPSASGDARRHHARPRTPLSVLAMERMELATRLTVCTTRHLLDIVSHAATSFPQGRAAYHTWRQQNMIACAHVRPMDSTTLALRLHSCLASLDGHPLLDTLHVAEEGDGLVIYATLSDNADLGRYGLTEDCEIVQSASRYVTVHRGERRWPLAMVTTRGSGRAREACTSVRDVVRLDNGVMIPNAPTVTVDVLTVFDSRHWTWCIH